MLVLRDAMTFKKYNFVYRPDKDIINGCINRFGNKMEECALCITNLSMQKTNYGVRIESLARTRNVNRRTTNKVQQIV